jgi:uncharacterized protein (TIRG00374 family)
MVAMVLYLVLLLWSGFDATAEALGRFPVRSRGPQVLGLVAIAWAVRGLRWHYYTRVLGLTVPFWPNQLAFAASFAFTATPGKAGEVVKSLLLKMRFGVPATATAGALLIERLMDLLAVLVLSIGGLRLADARLYFWGSLALLALLVLFVVVPAVHRTVLRAFSRVSLFGHLLFERPAIALEGLLNSGRRLLSPLPAAIGLALAVIAWGLEAVGFHWILSGLGAEVPLSAAASIFALATLVGALSMLPGGLGGFEATMLLLLTSTAGGLALSQGNAVAATLLIRLATLWFVSLLGALAMVLWWLWARRTAMIPKH